MNERIEQLAERATKEMDQEAFSEDMNIPAEWYHKFAELIVKECAWIAIDPAPSVYDHDSYKLGRKFAGIDVLKHFGVKE